MRSLVGLVRKDLQAAATSSNGCISKTTTTHPFSSIHHHHAPDPRMAQQVHDLLSAMERSPRDRRLAVDGLSVLRYHAAHEPAAHPLLLEPAALRAMWDAAQLHAVGGGANKGSDAVLEAFLAILLCITEHRADRARVRGSLPLYAPALVARLRGRVDRGSTGARTLEVLVRRLGLGGPGSGAGGSA